MWILLTSTLLASAVAAETDLSVSDLTVSSDQSFAYLTFDLGFRIDEVQDTYGFALTVTRERSGTTTTLGYYPNFGSLGSVLGKTNCSSCVTACSGTCKYKHNNIQHDGNCENNGACQGSKQHCICSGGTSKTVLLSSSFVQPGDVLSVIISPEDGVVESESGNNSVSIAF